MSEFAREGRLVFVVKALLPQMLGFALPSIMNLPHL